MTAVDAAGYIEISLAPERALGAVAADILRDQRAALPDLSNVVVLLPSLYPAAELARCLARQHGAALLLPRMTTLELWASSVPLPVRPLPLALQEAQLFDALRARDWFADMDLWALAAELARLFEELTAHGVSLPAALPQFVAQLETAYQGRAGAPLQFEARLVHELWHAAAQPQGNRVDIAAYHQVGLAHIAQSAGAPLYVMGLSRLTPAQERFLRSYGARAPVRRYRLEASAEDAAQATRLYASAWPAEETDGIRARARQFAAQCARSPIADRVMVYAANGLEFEARAVETQVRRWLIAGKRSVALVALDRVVARRVRALLERAGVLVADETGWLLSTTSAATVLMRWLDTLASDFYHEELFDLLKSPFFLCEWPERGAALLQLETLVRKESIVAGLRNYLAAAEKAGSAAAALQLLARLRQAAFGLQASRARRIQDWLSALRASLTGLEIDAGLRRDRAGVQLLQLLEERERELAHSSVRISFGELRRWLSRQLESVQFRDAGIVSPVSFTSLPLTRARTFDAVVLVGCDAAHLPGASGEGRFFNQSVRHELGLPTRARTLAQIESDLIALLASSEEALLTWQAWRNGEPNLASPYIERLQLFHELGWGQALEDGGLGACLPHAELPAPSPAALGAQTTPAAARLVSELVPRRISASAYNSLIACPYQYYARHALGLEQPDEVREEMEKRDYGDYVHRILRRFHELHPVASAVARERLEQDLNEISTQVFRGALEASYVSHAWLLRWQSAISAYIDWQIEREQAGWRFHAAELSRALGIELPNVGVLRLEGRIDRVDARAGTDEYAVLDYKTRAAHKLRELLADVGEDTQLPVYAELLGQPVTEALFLSVDRDDVDAAKLAADALAQSGLAIERLRAIFTRTHAGAVLPAQGIDVVCAYCEVRGMCRKDYWS